eukprot:CFRG3290T1
MSDGESEVITLDFNDLIDPLPLGVFKEEYWGTQVYSTDLDDDTFNNLLDGFHGCQFSEVAGNSRKDDNSKYTADEVSEMESSLDSNTTVNLPFCFTPGATAIKNAFISACEGFGNDVEVGVYFSVVGGHPAPWHLDNNHNITIQLVGEKDWLLIPGTKQDNLTSSREIHDIPNNQKEQRLPIPATGPANYTSQSLVPGSVLYVPPGHWHSVVPTSGESMSVDLRVANISHAKWIAEAVFALLSDTKFPHDGFHQVNARFGTIGPKDFQQHGGSYTDIVDMLAFVKDEVLPQASSRCRIPRCFPSQTHLSDGLTSGATLGFLINEGFFCETTNCAKMFEQFYMNPLVSVIAKRRGQNEIVLALRSVSSLSKSDFLHFNLVCNANLFPLANQLAMEGSCSLNLLTELYPDWKEQQCTKDRSSFKRRKVDSTVSEVEDVHAFLNVLLYGNVLHGK